MLVFDRLGSDGLCRSAIKYAKVRVITCCDLAFECAQSGDFGGALRHQAGDLSQIKAAFLALGPDQSQAELQGRDAAPGIADIATVDRF